MSQTFEALFAAAPAEVRAAGQTVVFEPGGLILAQGAPAEHIFFLRAGEAKVLTLTANGTHYLQYIYAAGELFGELECLNGQPVLSTVRASARCEMLRLAAGVFMDWMRRDAALACFISQQLAEKFYRLGLNAVINTVYPLRYRVLYYLWNASQQGQRSVSKADLVAGLGSQERSINRILRDLVNALVIDYDRGLVKISDPEHLALELRLTD